MGPSSSKVRSKSRSVEDYCDRITVGFVVPFVQTYCSERLRYGSGQPKAGKMSGAAKTVGQLVVGGLGTGAGALAGAPLAIGFSGGQAAGAAAAQKAAEHYSDQAHDKKSRAVVSETEFMDPTNQDQFWPVLTETALTIVHCWNHQFRTICELRWWSLILKTLAEDAVKRIFNYIAETERSGGQTEVNYLTAGVTRGKSGTGALAVLCNRLPKRVQFSDSMKAGKTFKLSTGKEWNTKEFFEAVGLISSAQILWERRSGSKTAEYGFRRMFEGEAGPDQRKYYRTKRSVSQAEVPLGDTERERVTKMALEKLTNGDPRTLARATNQTVHAVREDIHAVHLELLDFRANQTRLWLAMKEQIQEERKAYWTGPPRTGRFQSAHNLLLSTQMNLTELNRGFRRAMGLDLEYGRIDLAVRSMDTLVEDVRGQEERLTCKELRELAIFSLDLFLALRNERLLIPDLLVDIKALCLVGWKIIWDSEGSESERRVVIDNLLRCTVFLNVIGKGSEDLVPGVIRHVQDIVLTTDWYTDLRGVLKLLLVGLVEVFKVLGSQEAAEDNYIGDIADKIGNTEDKSRDIFFSAVKDVYTGLGHKCIKDESSSNSSGQETPDFDINATFLGLCLLLTSLKHHLKLPL